jgi:hypothetical protein
LVSSVQQFGLVGTISIRLGIIIIIDTVASAVDSWIVGYEKRQNSRSVKDQPHIRIEKINPTKHSILTAVVLARDSRTRTTRNILSSLTKAEEQLSLYPGLVFVFTKES